MLQIKTNKRKMKNKTNTKAVIATKLESVSVDTYATVLKAVKRYTSRKTGKISKNATELSTITGIAKRTVSRAITKMTQENLLRKEGVTRNTIYYFN